MQCHDMSIAPCVHDPSSVKHETRKTDLVLIWPPGAVLLSQSSSFPHPKVWDVSWLVSLVPPPPSSTEYNLLNLLHTGVAGARQACGLDWRTAVLFG